jgi:DNA-binding response OmpR family regulator
MKKVLIIEDEEIMRKALAEAFMREPGFEIITAENGQDGLAAALAQHPDIMLVDIMMPKMDGIAMLSELRKDAWGAYAKVILLTNVNDVNKIAEAMESGIGETYDYLIKADWKLEDIVKKVKERLGMA